MRGTLKSGASGLSHFGSQRNNRNSIMSIASFQSEAARSLPDLQETNEQAEDGGDGFDDPYVQGAPRSQVSLQRAASNAQRHRFQALEERQQERVSVDSNGHFLPLPEYTEEPNAPLPSRFRHMAGLDTPAVFSRPKPAVVTSANGTANGASSSSSSFINSPHTAPPNIGENFSADQAFRNANTNGTAKSSEDNIRETTIDHPADMMSVMESNVSTPTSMSSSLQRGGAPFDPCHPRNTPSQLANYAAQVNAYGIQAAVTFNSTFAAPGRTGTLDSLSSMPRSLQRAYSNAVPSIGHSSQPASAISEWSNAVSPLVPSNPPSSRDQASIMESHDEEDETWDTISPVVAGTSGTNSPSIGASPLRHIRQSISQPDLPGRGAPPITADNVNTYPSQSRRLPPHMQAFRSAAAANAANTANTSNPAASASLFPASQSSDHIPLRAPPTKAGSAAHPITAWHPPASSTRPPANNSSAVRNGSVSTHSRRSSIAEKSAFASTAKAKKLGFFKKSKRLDPWGQNFDADGGPPSRSMSHAEGASVLETKSVMTWSGDKAEKCKVM